MKRKYIKLYDLKKEVNYNIPRFPNPIGGYAQEYLNSVNEVQDGYNDSVVAMRREWVMARNEAIKFFEGDKL